MMMIDERIKFPFQ